MEQEHLEILAEECVDIAEHVVDHLPSGVEAFTDMLDSEYDVLIGEEEAEELVELMHSAAAEAIRQWALAKMK